MSSVVPWNPFVKINGCVIPPFLSIRLTNLQVSGRPPLCHPERTRISYLTALPAATYAALRKESRMTSTEATAFDRKSGGAEGPAVRPRSRTKVSVPLVLPQNRHPECSASPIDRVTQRSGCRFCGRTGRETAIPPQVRGCASPYCDVNTKWRPGRQVSIAKVADFRNTSLGG